MVRRDDDDDDDDDDDVCRAPDVHFRGSRGVRDGDDEPDRRRQGQDASAEEQQRCVVGTLENGRVGISRARREWFLRRINAVSDASDDVRRVTVRTVRPDEETVVVVTFCFAGR